MRPARYRGHTRRASSVSPLAYLAWAFERLGMHRDLYNLDIADVTPAAFKRATDAGGRTTTRTPCPTPGRVPHASHTGPLVHRRRWSVTLRMTWDLDRYALG